MGYDVSQTELSDLHLNVVKSNFGYVTHFQGHVKMQSEETL